ncbi:16S rRNA (uracil(1498)-N(3))-methyltransferase [Flavobacterium selenitireducens]|uniref:16S rRNA (uracil(1498)-N(3))-methyltransferase n=1 Tax=Flavobacterium selenitireducens TaxID=2722704 RepID=UPI00168B6B0B|nr:16S rRNA (uracil(1498)-N(3))-methyltransferase [Flavobacterium selenitireducens]MBD3580948.1 16S rRNA (uracil(1498)-N(3))-methyltransferase [Flavobacterium selenitireducens]
MQLFYNPDINVQTQSFVFDKEESRHIIKVLRKTTGDKIYVTNGLGSLFTTEISLASDSKCSVKIMGEKKTDPLPFHLHLAVAPTKMNDRYEWFLEKATEIGVSEITPLICDRSERTQVKIERFEKIVVSAMKQSNQYFLPKLNEAKSFKEFTKMEFGGQKFIAHCEETQKRSLKNELSKGIDVTILIGPEGDFTEKEIALAFEKSFIPVSLGETRLRTETAALVACHSVIFTNE